MRRSRNGFVVVLVALVFMASACDKRAGGPGGPGTGNPPAPPSPRPPETEKFDVLDSALRDTGGWNVENAERGRQSITPTAAGLELSVQRPFESGEAPQCLGSHIILRRAGLLKDLTEATIELQFHVVDLPKNVEYGLNVEAGIAPGKRLFSFTQQGVRTYTPEASVTVAPAQLSAGDHTARLVVKGESVWLYFDGKKLGGQEKGYLKLREPGDLVPDLVLKFLAIEKYPARDAEDCGTSPAKVVLKKIRVASQAFSQ